MKFLVDNQLPVELARCLSRTGFDTLHVADAGLAQSKDSQLWAYAVQEQRVLITMDEDFQHFAIRPGAATQVVWIRLGNTRKTALLNTLIPMWLSIVERLRQGSQIVEIR